MLILKKKLNNSLESKNKILKIQKKYSGKTVLIVGDGISSIYYTNHFKKYDYIICSNNSLFNKKLLSSKLLFWVCMEPYFCAPKFISDFFNKRLYFIQEMAKHNLKKLEHLIPVLHPTSRLSIDKFWINKKTIFISPHHNLKLEKNLNYNYFNASFQASLGIALLCGFKNVHVVGYDAWTLNPKNHLRWYSNAENCKYYDTSDSLNIDSKQYEFLKIASNYTNISIVSYLHYGLKFKQFNNIKVLDNFEYIPNKKRQDYMTEKNFLYWKQFEDKFFPYGYIVKK
jgi:hypothetical protein